MNNNRKAELFDAMLKWLNRVLDPNDFREVTEKELGIFRSEVRELGYSQDESGKNDEDDDGCFPGCLCRCCDCEHAADCALDKEIPCSPDCVNITRDGKVKIEECMRRQCGAADIVANAILDRKPHRTVLFSDGSEIFPESYTEKDAEILTGICGKVEDYPFELGIRTYYSGG